MIPFWLGMSCLLLFISGREGRVYNGRKKAPSLTGPRLRSGPHVCFSGMGGGCCPGWTISPSTGQCLQPLCSYGCGSGFCIAPNVCSCRDGHQRVTCADDFVSEHEKDLEVKGLPFNCLSAMCEQNCRLLNGVPVCSCFHGYNLGKDGKSCYDIDECSRPQTSSLCQHQCKNSIGSYRCVCFYGYQISPNGRSCITNKHPNIIAASVPCGEYGCELTCNEGGCEHVSRVCPIGFRMTETANGVTCTDIDECASSSCEGTCINTEGGFVCDCGPGMKLSADRTSCYDIDECSAKRSPCQQRCKNLHGSYRCMCGAGFILHTNGHTCADINECRRPGTTHLCKHFCHNTHGSFFCSCRAGFILGLDKVSCVDVDECLENTTVCPLGSCVNTLGSYLCSCPLGFLPISGGCSEIPLEMQTSSLPQETQAAHGDWSPLLSTLLMPQSPGTPSISASQTLRTNSLLAQEIYTTTPTSAPHSTLTDFDPIPAPQHLRTGHSPLAQKASGISHMPLKEDMIIQPGTPTVPHTQGLSSPCWHNKELYQTGSSWTEPGCLDCTCQEGNVSCGRRKCSPNCSHPVVHPNSCCSSCDGCLFEGISRADGELFSNTTDNCTICICLAGNVTCIPPVCPPVTCTEPFMSDCCLRCPDGCEFQDQVYPHGAKFSRDDHGCTNCLCQNGVVECSFVPCPSLECPREDWVLESSQCCFQCQKPPQSTGCPFDDNGIEIPIGQIWSPGDPCAVCICQADSSIVCKKTDCVETCPHPIVVPGQCCPDCSAGCSYGRKTFRNNESFPSTSDPCLTCICLMGTVACSPIECALNCTYPFHDEGECCPVCRDCTYDGRKVLNGQTFYLESEPCTQCTCQEGEVQCETILCSDSCSHPYVFPGECCSSCEDCAFEGHVLESGGSYILKTDPCVVCHCSAGNVQCEERETSCTPCEKKTQDCLNEVPDIFYTRQLQYSPDLPELKDTSNPLMILSDAKPSQSSRLSLFLKIISRRNTMVSGTHPPSFTPVIQTETLLDSVPSSYPGHILTSNTVHHIVKTDTSVTPTAESDPSLPSRTYSDILLPHAQTTDHPVSSIQTISSGSSPPSGSSFYASFLGLPSPDLLPSSDLRTTLPPSHMSIQSFPPTGRFSIPVPTTHPLLLNINTPGPTLAPTKYTSYLHKPKETMDQKQLPLTQVKHGEMKSGNQESGLTTGCFLNGLNFTNGSIFITDVDYCLQCECLKRDIYCKHEDYFPSGLCCRGCSEPPTVSCNGGINQVHSEQDNSQHFCQCRKAVLQCQSCSYKEGCRGDGTSQSSESEQMQKEHVQWVPLIFERGLKLKGDNPDP
ncbi:von Willebrand factor C and EGF domain-containing protein [Rhinophrynus dorsalis]